MQTIATIGRDPSIQLTPTAIRVSVSDGDWIVLHEDLPVVDPSKNDLPQAATDGQPSVLLVHGLTGCHQAPYMIRLADRYTRMGMRVFRMDMRGFGSAVDWSANLSHAGRSDDCRAALDAIAQRVTGGPMYAVGVSLGAGQLLRMAGRIGAGLDSRPDWGDRFAGLAAVSPPLDLARCSQNMQRWSRRIYNRYFIRSLLARIPPGVRRREDFALCNAGRRPRTLRELDDRFTAPLSGFSGVDDYYAQSSSLGVVGRIEVPTLVLTAADDPIVPVECFTDDLGIWSPSTQLIVTPRGGHVGFIDQGGSSWMDDVLAGWLGHLNAGKVSG
ncbi:putative hydrolase [Rubripirellula lacrimiformis]|uniref:Putative hydrolase n=1 Tax=Rubripirellula lacrimiformis TaxID=1930273 RepID=A0A517N6P6_9BACT|nr:alpha/beta fold hydrolase [Rubripirellula lacrimiformis]QDT02790.1 putative hydrolase [Rubripirellula lacrimiformis]